MSNPVEEIKSLSLEELSALVASLKQPPFRVQQLVKWLYQQHVSSYEEMTNLPSTLRNHLADAYPLYSPQIINKKVSQDGTRKYILRFHDGTDVETVAIPSVAENAIASAPTRLTVCVSSQAGCAMACSFCATGKEGFSRNLLPGEILDQVLLAQKDFGERVSNIVVMGQGEPFLNYNSVVAALKLANSPHGTNIGARRITVSTCGILPGIIRFSQEAEQFTLAVSLHSAIQKTRNTLMPALSSSPLSELKQNLLTYNVSTNRRITLEYIMIKNVNDTPAKLHALKRFCDGLLCHVNLLPINAGSTAQFAPSDTYTLIQWERALHEAGIEATIRKSRGSDISGACGQLKNTQ